jgi:hypothetical protein
MCCATLLLNVLALIPRSLAMAVEAALSEVFHGCGNFPNIFHVIVHSYKY